MEPGHDPRAGALRRCRAHDLYGLLHAPESIAGVLFAVEPVGAGAVALQPDAEVRLTALLILVVACLLAEGALEADLHATLQRQVPLAVGLLLQGVADVAAGADGEDRDLAFEGAVRRADRAVVRDVGVLAAGADTARRARPAEVGDVDDLADATTGTVENRATDVSVPDSAASAAATTIGNVPTYSALVCPASSARRRCLLVIAEGSGPRARVPRSMGLLAS